MEEKTDGTYYERIRDIFDEQFSVSSFVNEIDADNCNSEKTISATKEIVKKSIDAPENKKYFVDLPDEVKQTLEN